MTTYETNYSAKSIGMDYPAKTDDNLIVIDLLNKVTGTTFPGVEVLPMNTLDQILQEYAPDIGINPNDANYLFENKRTGKSTPDSSATVADLELVNGDVLAISDDARVASSE